MRRYVWLALVGATATAHADGVVVSARVGYDHYDPCPGCEDTPQPAWGIAGGLEVGYSFKVLDTVVGPMSARAGLVVDSFHANSTAFNAFNGGDVPVHFNALSLSAKLQLDVVPEYVFIWAALGEAVDPTRTQIHGRRYELGIGGRVWLDHGHHEAVRVDATYARLAFDEPTSDEQYGVALGFEHYF